MFTEPVTEPFVLLNGPVAECFAFGCWAGKKKFLHENGACQNDMKPVSLQFLVLLNGPVQNALFCLMGRYRNVLRLVHGKELPVPKGWNSRLPTWEPQVTIARNFPEVGTPGSQPGNHGLPLQATAGYQRLELMLPNLGTKGYHCKELPVPKVGTDGSQQGNHHGKELPVPRP